MAGSCNIITDYKAPPSLVKDSLLKPLTLLKGTLLHGCFLNYINLAKHHIYSNFSYCLVWMLSLKKLQNEIESLQKGALRFLLNN